VKTAGIPAVIYAFQNLLILAGYNYLDGLTLNLINQTKTLFTAVAVYLVMGRTQSLPQCFALAGMFGRVAWPSGACVAWQPTLTACAHLSGASWQAPPSC
jgi:threonine/homoserine/homoserine lactone efflux protein